MIQEDEVQEAGAQGDNNDAQDENEEEGMQLNKEIQQEYEQPQYEEPPLPPSPPPVAQTKRKRPRPDRPQPDPDHPPAHSVSASTADPQPGAEFRPTKDAHGQEPRGVGVEVNYQPTNVGGSGGREEEGGEDGGRKRRKMAFEAFVEIPVFGGRRDHWAGGDRKGKGKETEKARDAHSASKVGDGDKGGRIRYE